jgi:hypothetical protein
MASYKNSTRTRTRKRSKKTYRKKYRKTATKRMMGGGNPFSTLFSGIAGNISLFKSKAKEEATTLYDTKTKEVKEKVAGTKAYVDKKRECLAACARI